MSFGNAPSTVRAFRRVSPSSAVVGIPPSPSPVPSDPVTPPDSDAENHPPLPLSSSAPLLQATKPSIPPAPIQPATKESILGRRLFSKALSPALEECLAQTSTAPHRALLSSALAALTALDAQDPAGLWAVAKSLMAKVEADARLAPALLPGTRPPSGDGAAKHQQQSSIRVAKTPRGKVPSSPATGPGNKAAAAAVVGGKVGKRAQPPSSSSAAGTPPPGSPGLVLASANPHLRELRRKHSLLLLEERLPGRDGTVGQMEEAMFGRWREGLAGRWGA